MAASFVISTQRRDVRLLRIPDEGVSRGKVRSLGMTDMSRTCPYRRIRVSYTCVNRNSYNSICKMYSGELNEVKPLRRREILPELPPDFRGFEPKTGQKAGASSIPAEHDGAGPAGQQRERGGSEPLGEPVLARRAGDELLEPDLHDLDRRSLARQQDAVGEKLHVHFVIADGSIGGQL